MSGLFVEFEEWTDVVAERDRLRAELNLARAFIESAEKECEALRAELAVAHKMMERDVADYEALRAEKAELVAALRDFIKAYDEGEHRECGVDCLWCLAEDHARAALAKTGNGSC